MTVARQERAAIVGTLRAVGPDAPTLCEGWTARDLTAHLVLRERRLDATPGILVKPLAGYTAKVQDQIAKSTSWDDLVDKVAAGPPVYSPFKLLDPLVNVSEMFIHHEDARRGQVGWEPRVYDPETADALDKMAASGLSKMALRKSTVGVVAELPTRTVTLKSGEPVVTVVGDPGEVVLWISGRDAVRLEFTGDEAAIETLSKAKRGV